MSDSIPREVLTLIFSFLDSNTTLHLRPACKAFNDCICDPEASMRYMHFTISRCQLERLTSLKWFKPRHLEFTDDHMEKSDAQLYIDHVTANTNLTNLVLSTLLPVEELLALRQWESVTCLDQTVLFQLQGFKGKLRIQCTKINPIELQNVAAMYPEAQFSSIKMVYISDREDIAALSDIQNRVSPDCTIFRICLHQPFRGSFGNIPELVEVLNNALPAHCSLHVSASNDPMYSNRNQLVGLKREKIVLETTDVPVGSWVSEYSVPYWFAAKTVSPKQHSSLKLSSQTVKVGETRIRMHSIDATGITEIDLFGGQAHVCVKCVDLKRVRLSRPDTNVLIFSMEPIVCEISTCGKYSLDVPETDKLTLDLSRIKEQGVVQVSVASSCRDGIDIHVVNPYDIKTSITVHNSFGAAAARRHTIEGRNVVVDTRVPSMVDNRRAKRNPFSSASSSCAPDLASGWRHGMSTFQSTSEPSKAPEPMVVELETTDHTTVTLHKSAVSMCDYDYEIGTQEATLVISSDMHPERIESNPFIDAYTMQAMKRFNPIANITLRSDTLRTLKIVNTMSVVLNLQISGACSESVVVTGDSHMCWRTPSA